MTFKHKFNINCMPVNDGDSSMKSSAYATAPAKIIST